MLCSYFGRWPVWINFFVESCKWNPDVHWRIHTDCGAPENHADNITYVDIGFADYKALVRDRLGVAFDPVDPYKLCDLKPAFGFLHRADIRDYPFYGYGDIDVIYGGIARFYGGLRADYDVLSTHPERCSGHFMVLRNTAELRNAFRLIPNYRDVLVRESHLGIDESAFTPVLLSVAGDRALFVERYSTIYSPRGWHDGTMKYPQRWFWREGRLTNDRDGAREFLYLHFMRWQSAHWINNPPLPGEAAWLEHPIVHTDWRRAESEGFCISEKGFTPIA